MQRAATSWSTPPVRSTNGEINATAGGAITEASSSGQFGTSGLLTTVSTTGQNLNDANTVGSFNASNSTSGDLQFNNAAAPLTITSINEAVGNVQVMNFGGMLITGTITDTAAAGIVSLKEWTTSIEETPLATPTGRIVANLLITQSKSGTLLNGANAVSGLIAVNDPSGGDFQLTNTLPLTIEGIIETGGNLTVVNAGGIGITGTVKDLGGTVNLKDTAAGIQEIGAGSSPPP